MIPFDRRQFMAIMTSAALLPRVAHSQGPATVQRLRCHFADQDFSFRLEDNATARDLLAMLPLALTIEDFSSNEKLAHLPRRLDETGRQPFTNEMPGDLCYFRGWGNLAFFHSAYTASSDLILLGRIEGAVAPLLVRGTHPLQLELVS